MIDKKKHEELRNKFNSDGTNLRKHQMRMLDMLKFIDKVCRNNEIRYWLSSGTCLGAVRHGGFIPWDDDVDIEMLPNDYLRFSNIIKKMGSDKYVLQTFETDSEYVAPYAKLRDLNSMIKENNSNDLWYKYNGFYIDVFPVYTSSSRFVIRLSWILQLVLLHKLSKIRFKALRRALTVVNHALLYKFIFPILNMWKSDNGRFYNVGGLGSGFYERYKKEYVDELIDVEFEGDMYPIPKNYDGYLSSLYGNYMEIPSVDQIHPHVNNLRFT